MSPKAKRTVFVISISAVILVAVALFADNIMNAVINKTMDKDLP